MSESFCIINAIILLDDRMLPAHIRKREDNNRIKETIKNPIIRDVPVLIPNWFPIMIIFDGIPGNTMKHKKLTMPTIDREIKILPSNSIFLI